MMKKIRSYIGLYCKEEKGAAAVEFGIIAWAFITLLFGIVEVSRVMWTYNSVQYAVENASRFVIVNEDASNADIIDVANSSLLDMRIDTTPFTVSVNFFTDNGTDFVEIDATYSFSTIVLAFFPESFNSFDITKNVTRPLIWNNGGA